MTPHGTRTGYDYHGCRCQLCRAANAAYKRRWRARNPEKARIIQRAANARYAKAHPEKVRAKSARTVWFVGKHVHVPVNPRTGVCQRCGRARKPGERQFVLHHNAYIPGRPLWCTEELCPQCHREHHKRIGKGNPRADAAFYVKRNGRRERIPSIGELLERIEQNEQRGRAHGLLPPAGRTQKRPLPTRPAR